MPRGRVLRRLRRPRLRTWLPLAVMMTLALLLGLYLRQSSPPRKIVMATGQEGGMYDTFGLEYARRLGRLGLQVEIVRTNGSVDNLRRVIGRTADVAFVQAGTHPLVDDPAGV